MSDVRYYVAVECGECGEENIVDICTEYGYNPGTDGHAFRTAKEARDWATRMNREQPTIMRYSSATGIDFDSYHQKIKYFPIAVTIKRI